MEEGMASLNAWKRMCREGFDKWRGVSHSEDTDVALPEVLDAYFKTPKAWQELATISSGTNLRRRRLQPSVVLNYEMPLPPMQVQKKIQQIPDLKQKLLSEQMAILTKLSRLMPPVLESIFGEQIEEPRR